MAYVLVEAPLAKVGKTVAGHNILSVGKLKILNHKTTCKHTNRMLEPGNYRWCEIKVNQN